MRDQYPIFLLCKWALKSPYVAITTDIKIATLQEDPSLRWSPFCRKLPTFHSETDIVDAYNAVTESGMKNPRFFIDFAINGSLE